MGTIPGGAFLGSLLFPFPYPILLSGGLVGSHGRFTLAGAISVAWKPKVFLAELKRRKVYHVAGVYVMVAFALWEGADIAFPRLGLPDWTVTLVLVLTLIGLPIALLLAWAYEVKPEEPRPARAEKESLTSDTIPPTAVTTTEQRKSIVVLPFDNMSPDPGDAYLSDGLTEEIITNLSHLRSLRVISRSSAMVLKGTQKDVRTIGKELDVQYVLEGSVRKVADDLRMTAQLIDAGSDEHLWAETYDGTMDDVFQIQEQTARSIVEALRVSLTPEEKQNLAERPIDDVEAFQLYLMAKQNFWAGTPDGLERARRQLENGLDLIGENGVLLEGLAEVQFHTYLYGVKTDDETLGRAEDLVDRAVAQDPDSALSQYLKGRMELLRYRVTSGIAHFERALAIDPTHSGSLNLLFHSYSMQAGRPEYAAPMRELIREQNPLVFLTWWAFGVHDWMKGDLEKALSTFQRAGELEGGSDMADICIAYILIWLNRIDEARSLIGDLERRETPGLFTEWAQFLERALEGKGASAQEALGDQARGYLWRSPEFMWLGASTIALSGQKEEALDWLEHVVDSGWINYPLLSEQDPLLESIRGEERFKEMMVGVKRDWEAFGAQLRTDA